MNLTFDQLTLFLIFVVPGFVAMKTHDLLIPGQRRDWGSSLIEVISYSMMNLALLFWAVHLLHRERFQAQHPVGYFLGMFGVLFIAPVVWAILARALRSLRVVQRFMVDPRPTAWDFFFDQRRPVWALFHLKTGQKLGGLLAESSTASAYPYLPDIYVEEVWRVDEQGRFSKRIEQTAGALIKRDDCSHIEFFTLERDDGRFAKPKGKRAGDQARRLKGRL